MKKLLFVGYLTDAHNWGARGTSTTFMLLVQQQFQGREILPITYRSYLQDTPSDGWKKKSLPKQIYHSLAPYRFRKKIRTYIRPERQNIGLNSHMLPDSVPATVDEFEPAALKMLKGEILPYEARLLQACDEVLINGEGSIVHSKPGSEKYRRSGRYILFLAYVTKKHLQKPCYIVNHTVDPAHPDAEAMVRLVYPMLDYVAVREPCSVSELRRIGYPGPVALVPDALFAYQPEANWSPSRAIRREIDFKRDYICLGDSSAAPYVPWDIYDTYKRLIEKLSANICKQVVLIDGNSRVSEILAQVSKDMGVPYITVRRASYQDLYQIFKCAKMFISGRWHSSILSAMSGTPVVLWGADSHKTKGFLELFDYPGQFFPIDSLDKNIDRLVNEASHILEKKDEVRDLLLRKSEQFAEQVVSSVEMLAHQRFE